MNTVGYYVAVMFFFFTFIVWLLYIIIQSHPQCLFSSEGTQCSQINIQWRKKRNKKKKHSKKPEFSAAALFHDEVIISGKRDEDECNITGVATGPIFKSNQFQ